VSVHKSLMIAKLLKAMAQVTYWPRALRLIRDAAPRWTLIWAFLLIVQGTLPVFSVYLIKLLVDSLVTAVNAGGEITATRPVILFASLLAAVMMLTEFLQSATEWVRLAQSELVQDHIKNLIHKQSATVDLAFYDSPEYYDRLEQALSDGANRPLSMLESFGGVVQNSITLIAMATLLISYGIWLPLVLVVSTLPAFFVVLRFDRRYHRWWQSTTSVRRWIQYFDTMLTHGLAAPEVRVFGVGDHFRNEYQSLRKGLRNERLRQMKQLSFGRLGSGAIAVFVIGGTMVWMGWRALHGAVTLGDLALFYQAFNRGQDLMRSLLGSVGKILTNSLFLEDLFAFFDLKPRVTDPELPVSSPSALQHGIEFNNVTFRYPGSEKPIFKNFSFSVPAGKTVAIVGVNGAGKSTLFKLLCRFYDPEEGTVTLDGIDLRDISLTELWRLITVTFQKPLNYHATVRHGIALGDLNSASGTEEIEAAAQRAGATDFIMRLPNGYDTLLGKIHADGVELSGGEWQRLALARAYFRQSPIILLDEPTSFIDSWAESDWFSRFGSLAKGRTSIVITHRFNIAKRADIIHVMDAGQIIESGSHYELLAHDGFYAESWRAQSETASGGDAAVAADPFDRREMNAWQEAQRT
jgi:ATP-binding cassette, subfamily B, bacterial